LQTLFAGGLVNRYDDEFATTLSALVEQASPLTPSFIELPVTRRWSEKISGPAAVRTGASVDQIKLTFNAALSEVRDRTLAIGFTYALSPLIESATLRIDGDPPGVLAVIANHADVLRARHGKAFGFVLVRPVSDVNTFTLTLALLLAPDSQGSPSSAFDIDLSSFVLYRLYEYATAYETSPTLAWQGPIVSQTSPSPLNKLQLSRPFTTPAAVSVKATLTARADTARSVVFSGIQLVGSSGVLKFEFPLLEPESWSILPYLARLSHYGFATRHRILSYAERIDLDARQPRLPVPIGPQSLLNQSSQFRWMHRVLHLHSDMRNDLGGGELVNLEPILSLCQSQQVSILSADVGGYDAAAAFNRLAAYGLMSLNITFKPSMDMLAVGGQGSGAVPTALTVVAPKGIWNLFKNPIQFDIDVLTRTARAFAATLGSVAARGLAPRDQVVVSIPEIGDTHAPTPFLLPAKGPDALQRTKFLAELHSMGFRLPRAWSPHSSIPNELLIANALRMSSDAQYHQSYWQHLLREYDERVVYWTGRVTVPALIPPQLLGLAKAVRSNLKDLYSVFSVSPPASFNEDCWGGDCIRHVRPDYSRFDDVVPSNGPHDLSIYGTPGLPSRPYSVRRAAALGSVSGQVQWYCQFRHWVQANCAYLVAASSALKQALNGAPHLTDSNLSKATGYWGFEGYHTVRSGALDAVFLHDQTVRATALRTHLIFSNVLADFGRALSALPSPEERPFEKSPRPLGALFSNERVDLKAIIWASRGATSFECFFSGDANSEKNAGWGNSGDVSYQPLAQGRSAMRTLNRSAEFLERARREPARVCLLVPQTASIWTLSDGGPDPVDGSYKGFSHDDDLLDDDFHGVHSMFTHQHVAVDMLFEESIIDAVLAKRPCLPESCHVLYVGTAYLRDDVFHAIATWVMSGGVLLLAPGLVSKQSDQRLAARLNEYAQDRDQIRSGWLDLFIEDSPPGPKPSVRKTSKDTTFPTPGCIVDLEPDQSGKNWGERYIGTANSSGVLGLNAYISCMVPPANLAATLNHRATFAGAVDRALVAAGKDPLAKTRSAWAEPNPTTDPPLLVEVIDLRRDEERSAPRGAVVVVNHQHRDYDRSKWFAAPASAVAPLDNANAEAPRQPTPMVLHLMDMGSSTEFIIEPNGMSGSVARDPDGVTRIPLDLATTLLLAGHGSASKQTTCANHQSRHRADLKRADVGVTCLVGQWEPRTLLIGPVGRPSLPQRARSRCRRRRQ
jgi:hypothetical protein